MHSICEKSKIVKQYQIVHFPYFSLLQRARAVFRHMLLSPNLNYSTAVNKYHVGLTWPWINTMWMQWAICMFNFLYRESDTLSANNLLLLCFRSQVLEIMFTLITSKEGDWRHADVVKIFNWLIINYMLKGRSYGVETSAACPSNQ